MIVARGLGRWITGATGIIAAAGLGLVVATPTPPIDIGGGGFGRRLPVPHVRHRWLFDDRDLLELVPIIVEVLNRGR